MPSPGALLQLVAMGKQDVFLTGNPQISFYKMVYRRFTNFSVESCRMYFDGTPNFGQRITCLIPRFGDLLGNIFLDLQLPALTLAADNSPVSYVNSPGHALIDEITFEIGEQEIDKQTGEFMEIWTQLTTPAGQVDALNNMIARGNNYTAPQLFGAQNLLIPLQFWFCRNPGNYLPILALQYHPLRINIKLRPLQDMVYTGNPALKCVPGIVNPATITSLSMWGDYVQLDTEERRRFVSAAHEYLIDQVQYTPKIAIPAASNTANIKMDFNHPIRELLWVVQRNEMIDLHEYFNYSSLAITDVSISPRTDNIISAKVQLDGQDRFERRTAPYFRLVQPYQRHTTTPVTSFIYVYSFALRPEDAQPSGSVNVSRIDSFNLLFDMCDTECSDPPRGNATTTIYAVNHNVLRVIDGFGGLLFKV
jgi:hypothetical protein